MDAISEANLYLSYERQQQDAARQRPVLPVTIITGFLGAGKTTLLRRILRLKHNLRIATIVNEYGSMDHDGGVVERDGQTDRIDKLAGGCVCCHGSLGSHLEDSVAELLRRPDHDRYDYLVIETSGVSDPEAIIRTLDKSFGKLTRARLDAVVTVMDADALLHQMGDDEEQMRSLPIAVKRQIENADVIVLNKSDLLHREQLSKLSDRVQQLNNIARVLVCSYGQIPIHTVLDIEAPRTDVQGVSHERVSTHLYVSTKGGNLRRASSSSQRNHSTSTYSSDGRTGLASGSQRSTEQKVESGSGGHLRDDGMEQVTFTSTTPFSLTRFQDWVCYGLPEGVVRVKGILAFDEDRLTRCVFNMSGRRRLSVENDGKWEGPMRLYLVVIGVRIDRAAVVAALENLCVGESSQRIGDEQLAATASSTAEAVPRHPGVDEMCLLIQLLAQDPLFDAIPPNAAPEGAPNIFRFRFTGAGAYGMPVEQLSLKFGVDFDSVNRSILRAVNNGATGYRDPSTSKEACIRHGATAVSPSNGSMNWACSVFLTFQEGVRLRGDGDAGPGQDEECLVLRFAVGGDVSLVSAWPMVVERTRELMKTELGHIHFCNCFS